jgi:hypothetical protein
MMKQYTSVCVDILSDALVEGGDNNQQLLYNCVFFKVYQDGVDVS